MFETLSKYINGGSELAAYSWKVLKDLKPRGIEIPLISCWCRPFVYYKYIEGKDRGICNLPPVPKEAFGKDEELKREFLRRVEKKYGKTVLVPLDGELIDDKKYDPIFGNFGVIEEHGLHLSLDSDNIRIYGLTDMLSLGESDALIIPSLSYGVTNPYEYDFPGTINLGSDVLEKMARNYINEIKGALGNSRILFLTAHAHRDHRETIERVIEDFGDDCRILFRFDFGLVKDRFKIRGHSSKNETSVIMFYRPGMVDLKNAKGGKVDRESYNKRGYVEKANIRNRSGVNCYEKSDHPKLSTLEFGEMYVVAMVEKIENLMKTMY